MYKIFYRILIILILAIISTTIYLSFYGLKTSKFNQMIENKILEVDQRLKLELKEVYLKLNLKNLEIKANTKDSKLLLGNYYIEFDEINLNFDLFSIFKEEKNAKNFKAITKENSIKNLLIFVNKYKFNIPLVIVQNKIKDGSIILEANVKFDEKKGNIVNYDLTGLVKKTNINITDNSVIENLNFNFNIRPNYYLFKNIKLIFENINFKSDTLEVKKNKNNYIFKGSVDSLDTSVKPAVISKIIKFNLGKNLKNNFLINSQNKFSFILNNKLKIKDFKIDSIIKLNDVIIDYKSKKINKIIPSYKEKIYLNNTELNLNIKNKVLSILGTSKYKINKEEDKISFSYMNKNNKNIFETNINFNKTAIKIKNLNYYKNKNSSANITIKGSSDKKFIKVKNFNFTNKKNKFVIDNIILNKKLKIISVDKLSLKFDGINNLKNNINLIKNGNHYDLKGTSFDFSNYLETILKSNGNDNFLNNFEKLNTNLNVKINKLYLDKFNYLNNVNGKIKFVKNKTYEANLDSINSNGDKFSFTIKTLDDEKVTTMYVDNAEPFVRKFDFIKDFKRGNLDFYSVKKNDVSQSLIKIYDFKLKDVPVLTKLLSLASLQGIADLMTGEGVRFTEFEMNFRNDNELMTIDEIYSIGPAISVLMNGYIQKDKLISLRGTLVPATTINKTIGSIPILGDILIGKKTGEGVFGVSFKIKGPPENLKTTVNPIKTLTPRFITRTLEKIKSN